MIVTGTNLKDDIINYGGDEVAEIGDSPEQFLIWVSFALVNQHETVCDLFNKWTKDTITFNTSGFEIAVPEDWDAISSMVLYRDENHQSEYDRWKEEFGVHRFDVRQATSQVYYRRYRLQPSTYTSMDDVIVEASNPRLKKVIMEETIAQYLAAQNDLEASNAEESTLNKSNRNS